MHFQRSAGVLLHITSLPGPCGIGDLGAEAHRFVDFLASAGQSYWQILPVGPSDHGSPYLAQSSWAGSPFLISLEGLISSGDLTQGEVDAVRVAPGTPVDFGFVGRTRRELLDRAAERFFARGDDPERQVFEHFCQGEAFWLEDWALFAAARRHFDGQPWWCWPRPLALRTAAGLKQYRAELAAGVMAAKYVQFRFYQQWGKLRAKAAEAGLRMIGDVPIYCASDSADVWASRELFQLDKNGAPKAVSGVPPDYFAVDGQLWGHPVFDWKKNAATGFSWWISRLRGALRHADIVRIDHFRAFEAYWEVPAEATTARDGKWVKGPGDAFFEAVRAALGEAPFIAEDLGVITRGVRELRDRWELPGMRVLQFAFGEGASSPHLPIHHVRNCVVYTGTHDNDTTTGWYEKASEREQDAFRRFTSSDGSSPAHHMMRAAYASVADLAVVPMQDLLGLGSWARMNVPAVADGNWTWMLSREQINESVARSTRELAEIFGRLPGQARSVEDESALG